MNDSVNPYATPEVKTVLSSTAQNDIASYYVEKRQLWVTDGVELPDICIMTGERVADGKRRKKKLYWSNPWLILLIFLSPLVYVIVYYIVRKGFTFHYSITPKALMKRRIAVLFSSLLVFGSFAGSVILISMGGEYAGMGGLLLLFGIVSLLLLSYFLNAFRPKKHLNGWFSFVGAGKVFMKSLESQ